MIYTANAIESLRMQLRKVLKNRGHFPSDESAMKLIYLALRNITKKWNRPPTTWKPAAGQFAIQFGTRFFSSATPEEKTQKPTDPKKWFSDTSWPSDFHSPSGSVGS